MDKLLAFLRSTMLTGVFLFTVGCAERYYPVSGVVTMDNAPFANGSITLIPEKGGAPAFGGTDAQGHFTLETGNKQGVRAGGYKVTLQRFSTPRLNPKDVEGRETPTDFTPMSLVPEKYTKAETTDVTISVPSTNDSYQIQIKTK